MGKIEVAAEYMKQRTANNIDGVLALCADDVVLESSKDGTKSGKAEFKAYLEKNGPKGTWQDPVADGDNVIVMGKVSFMMIPVSVKAVFSFNSDDKITKIVIGKA